MIPNIWNDMSSAPRLPHPYTIILLHRYHGAIEGWYSQGEWSENPSEGRTYSGSVWVLGDDLLQEEVEELPHGEYNDGSIIGWLPRTVLPPERGIPISEYSLPPDDQLIIRGHGQSIALMFLYCHEGIDTRDIAEERGFDIKYLMFEDDPDASEEQVAAYEADAGSFEFSQWNPKPPEGWTLGGKHDTEEGPVAIFLRRKVKTPKISVKTSPLLQLP